MGGIGGYAGNQFFESYLGSSNLPFAMTRSDTALVAPTFISKVKDFATSGPGMATILWTWNIRCTWHGRRAKGRNKN